MLRVWIFLNMKNLLRHKALLKSRKLLIGNPSKQFNNTKILTRYNRKVEKSRDKTTILAHKTIANLHNNRVKFPQAWFLFCSVHQQGSDHVRWKPTIIVYEWKCQHSRLKLTNNPVPTVWRVRVWQQDHRRRQIRCVRNEEHAKMDLYETI